MPSAGEPSAAAAKKRKAPRVPRANLTGRAIALAVVILVLVISYASSLRVYFAQAHEIAATKVEIAQRQQAIEDLQAERARWDNPDYVRAQARERLGWVVPGEIGYRVVDANGNPVGGGEEIEGGSSGVAPPSKTAWWTKLEQSVKSADQPAPVEKSGPPTVTVQTKPGG
ncbi:hypothetical protein GCM10022236_48540 [Microlunatus ginsengisoli]|uniref:Cell division protein FtsB n=1 Tax=Microlunatus ginsengisoli TaxID=363863 RepID=A0ABP7ATF3_9ACTN